MSTYGQVNRRGAVHTLLEGTLRSVCNPKYSIQILMFLLPSMKLCKRCAKIEKSGAK